MNAQLFEFACECSISTRLYNCIERGPYSTIAELSKATDKELLKIKDLGKTSIRELREALAIYQSRKPHVMGFGIVPYELWTWV
jgi:DNA-directed RNA polymerase alpha subunit